MSAPAADPSAATGWPRRRVLAALLVISLVLNLGFVAGALWSRWQVPARWAGAEQRYQKMAADLDLDPQQRIGFDRYVAAMRAGSQKMRQETEPLIATAWGEMSKPQADVAQIMRLYDEASEKRRIFQRDSAVQTHEFLAVLSPAQRGKFVAIARERRGPWLRRHPPTH